MTNISLLLLRKIFRKIFYILIAKITMTYIDELKTEIYI